MEEISTATTYELRATGIQPALVERAQTDPLVRAYLDAYLYGRMPREEMLIQLAVALSEANETLRGELVRLIAVSPPRPIVIEIPPLPHIGGRGGR